MKVPTPLLQRRLIGIPAWLIGLIAIIGLVALGYVPPPTWTPRSFQLQAYVTQFPDGSIQVNDLTEWTRLNRSGGRLIAEINHTQQQMVVSSESKGWWPTYENDCFRTLITLRGQNPSTTRLMTEQDDIWKPVCEYIASVNPAQSGAILANGFSASRRWAPGELQNRIIVGRWLLWLALGVSVLRFVVPLPMTRGARRRALGQCPSCGYDMRGSASGICPECGEAEREPRRR